MIRRRKAEAGWWTSGDSQASGNQLEALVWLYHGDPNVTATPRSVHPPGADQSTTLGRQPLGEFPSVAHREPQVEAPRGPGHGQPTPSAEDRRRPIEPPQVSVALG